MFMLIIGSISKLLSWIVYNFRPLCSVVLFHKIIVISFGELNFGFPCVHFCQVIFDEEIIDAELLFVRKSIYSSKRSSIFVEFSSLDSDNFPFNHSSKNLFHILAKLLDLARPCLGGIDAIESEIEPGELPQQFDEYLQTVSVSHFGYFAQKRFEVQRKLLHFCRFQEIIILWNRRSF